MSGYFNVLNRAVSLDSAPAFEPYTGVRLWYDDEHYYFAGDDSGRVLEQDQPWATQAMADSILANLRGFVYQPFEAGTAQLDMEAELGDGVNVGGVYSLLAEVNTTFGAMCASDLAAPSEEEVNHEYPYKPKQQRQMERSFRQVYSLIEKTDSAIRLMVVDEIEGLESELEQTAAGFFLSVSELNGKYSALALTVDGFTVTDQSGTTRIKGSSIETETLYVDAAHINGTLTADQVVLTGSISWADLDSGVQNNINSAGGISSSDAETIITRTLVSSPTIQGAEIIGGTLKAVDKSAELIITDEGIEYYKNGYKDWRFVEVTTSGGHRRLQIDTCVYEMGLYLGAGGDIDIVAESRVNIRGLTDGVYFTGNVNFSGANVSGLVPVWG